ncbi:MAG: KH domain-containing protein [Anaerolineae bacterium]
MKEKELIEYIARQLVEKPDKVRVKETRGANVTMLELHVDREDMGRVIGKDGRVANALRTLLRVAAGDRRVVLEIV